MIYAELHNHLYGSISSKKLFEIGQKNSSPRWFIFEELYKQLYGKNLSLEDFWKIYDTPEKFKNIYLFNKQAPFLEFQCKFNLIIALTRFDETEIQEVTREIVGEHFAEGIRYIEYKITYSPLATKADYHSKTIALCTGLQLGEKDSPGIEARLIITFHRGGNFREQYEWMKELMSENELVRKYLVAIDFSSMEEGFPPKDKKEFFSKVLKDNAFDPKKALAITYHVGESFADKTPLSAIRWILESCLSGVHRIGHAIALGENPSKYEGKIRKEKKTERIDHLQFLIKYYEEISGFGKWGDLSELKIELEILEKSNLEYYEILMDEKYIREISQFQEYGFSVLQKMGTVIESCPTSNYLIGMIETYSNLPLKKFVEKDIKLTIGADDPGIFDTNLQNEYVIAENIGVSQEKLEIIREKSFSYKSEILTGRKEI